MENTYTFVARSADDPYRVVTLTLPDHQLTVGMGPPLKQLERARVEGEAGVATLQSQLWLRPLAISLLQHGVRPFPLADISAELDGPALSVKAWVRAARLRAIPLTLVDGRVDNPDAAEDFVHELQARKSELELPLGFLELLDYWATWILGGVALISALVIWSRRRERA